MGSLGDAEFQLLIAAQRSERQRALAAIDASLSAQHASAISAVVSKYADRRAALAQIGDAGERAAAGRHLSAEEAAELARLVLVHAAEKRQLRK